MFGALKRGHFRSLASLILVVNVVGELQRKRIAASRGFLATARLSCCMIHPCDIDRQTDGRTDGRAIAYSALIIYAMLSRAKKKKNICCKNVGPSGTTVPDSLTSIEVS